MISFLYNIIFDKIYILRDGIFIYKQFKEEENNKIETKNVMIYLNIIKRSYCKILKGFAISLIITTILNYLIFGCILIKNDINIFNLKIIINVFFALGLLFVAGIIICTVLLIKKKESIFKKYKKKRIDDLKLKEEIVIEIQNNINDIRNRNNNGENDMIQIQILNNEVSDLKKQIADIKEEIEGKIYFKYGPAFYLFCVLFVLLIIHMIVINLIKNPRIKK